MSDTFRVLHPGITLVNEFVCEIEAEGTLVVATKLDQPGMIGIIGMCLGRHGVTATSLS